MVPIEKWIRIAVAVLSIAHGVSGAGGQSIFKLGDEIDKKNWDIMGMYYIVFGVTICFELVVTKVEEGAKSESAKAVSHHVTQEIMILGGISAVLVVFENLGGSAIIDAPLFHYVHFVIFVMAIVFICLVSSLFYGVDKAWEQWTRFELKVDEIETDPSLTYEGRAAFLQYYVKSVPDGQQMLSGIIFFRQNLPGPFTDVAFNRYMKKMQRKWLLGFLSLHETTWGLLGVLCLLAAIVTYFTLQVSENEMATIGLWTLFVGFAPLIVLMVTFFKVRREYKYFNYEVQEMRLMGSLRPQKPQSDHFWWGKPHRMALLIQTMLLYQVFFIATAGVNFTNRLLAFSKYGWLILIASLIPSFFVFFFIIPLVMPPFTILASVGDFLDHDTLLRMKVADRKSGKYRRQEDRDAAILEPARFIVDDVATVTRQVKTLKTGPDDDISLPLLGQSREDAKNIFKHGRSIVCEECEVRAATMYCPICDVSLCEEDDGRMHVLKKLSTHKRVQTNTTSKGGVTRIDPTDGEAYTFDEFLAEYGAEGVTRWNKAIRVQQAPPMSPGLGGPAAVHDLAGWAGGGPSFNGPSFNGPSFAGTGQPSLNQTLNRTVVSKGGTPAEQALLATYTQV
eukprot:Hpha_TRINITY_DN10727_c0_g1::TRINITY_DN10727_c0_g1_i1::g.43761::m.43761